MPTDIFIRLSSSKKLKKTAACTFVGILWIPLVRGLHHWIGKKVEQWLPSWQPLGVEFRPINSRNLCKTTLFLALWDCFPTLSWCEVFRKVTMVPSGCDCNPADSGISQSFGNTSL